MEPARRARCAPLLCVSSRAALISLLLVAALSHGAQHPLIFKDAAGNLVLAGREVVLDTLPFAPLASQAREAAARAAAADEQRALLRAQLRQSVCNTGVAPLLQAVGQLWVQDARGVATFNMDGRAFVAVANFGALGPRVYVYNASTRALDPFQAIDTSLRVASVEPFAMAGTTYLALAESYDPVAGTNNVNSTIHRFNATSQRFEPWQKIATRSAQSWHAFKLGGRQLLGVSNYIGVSRLIESNLYEFNAERDEFVPFQELSTQGALDMASFQAGGHTYLAVANNHNGSVGDIQSHLYIYDAEQNEFSLHQAFDTFSVFDFEVLRTDDDTVLLVASNSYAGGLPEYTHLLRFNTTSMLLELVQSIPTASARAAHAFSVGSSQYVVLANYQNSKLPSRLYTLNARTQLLEFVQDLPVEYPQAWASFRAPDDGTTYVLVGGGQNTGGSPAVPMPIFAVNPLCDL